MQADPDTNKIGGHASAAGKGVTPERKKTQGHACRENAGRPGRKLIRRSRIGSREGFAHEARRCDLGREKRKGHPHEAVIGVTRAVEKRKDHPCNQKERHKTNPAVLPYFCEKMTLFP